MDLYGTAPAALGEFVQQFPHEDDTEEEEEQGQMARLESTTTSSDVLDLLGLQDAPKPAARRMTSARATNEQLRKFRTANHLLTCRFDTEHQAKLDLMQQLSEQHSRFNRLETAFLEQDLAHRLLRTRVAVMEDELVAAADELLDTHVKLAEMRQELATEKRRRESMGRERDAEKMDASKVPAEFFCPITQDLMCDPVICVDGFTYERDAIQTWFSQHDTSPMTRAHVASKLLIPNRALRSMIADHIERNHVRRPSRVSIAMAPVRDDLEVMELHLAEAALMPTRAVPIIPPRAFAPAALPAAVGNVAVGRRRQQREACCIQ